MIRATISQVKNSLSAYLRRVRAGETVLIMDRRTPVASLGPVPQKAALDPRLGELISAGLIAAPTGAESVPGVEPGDRADQGESPRRPPRVKTDADVLGVLMAERRSGR